MKTTIAFVKKEWMELVRSNKALIASMIFLFFGIMNPAITKLTPALFDLMSDQLKEQGMEITNIEVTAASIM